MSRTTKIDTRTRHTATPADVRLAVVLIAKNEAKYLEEWIAHHRAIGFDYFLIYDNESTDGTWQLLGHLTRLGYLDSATWPTVERMSPQLSAYNNALSRLRGRVEYVAFLDADEFLIPTAERSVKDVLFNLAVTIPDFGAMAINQRVFGPNGEVNYSPEPVLKRFPNCVADGGLSGETWVKTVYRLSHVERIECSHRSPLARGRYYSSSGIPLDFLSGVHSGVVAVTDFSAVQLNHYIVKSTEEFADKRARGGVASSIHSQRLARYSKSYFNEILTAESIPDLATKPFADSVETKIQSLRESYGPAASDGWQSLR